jgi:hypothetical protein
MVDTTDTKEWTLMFYFASDNPLAPGILSQLKSIQQAGFHPEVNVVAQYDPHTERVPTHIFDVNKVAKLKALNTKQPFLIGFKPDEVFVTNLVLDKLWVEQENVDLVKTEIGQAGAYYEQPAPPGSKKKRSKAGDDGQEPGPKESLSGFLEFCRQSYPAKRYMLFILGHGLVVGNDMFLFDEHAAQKSLSLRDLGEVLGGFKRKVSKDGRQFELVSFHSCSMSALEVAYELKETANYMLASQGPAFVGSWPYRQILMRVLQDVVRKEKDLKETLRKIFAYCLYNSRDFQLAGYSFDLTLCDLNKVTDIKDPLRKLSAALTTQVVDRFLQECILLAHWDAQSYWGESYTDLYDFCSCLNQRCENAKGTSKTADTKLLAIQQACCEVVKTLEPGDDKLVICSGSAGAEYQYSHGFSVFFPWSAPANGTFWPKEYEGYKFSNESKGTRWNDFLNQYFNETMRDPRGSESQPKGKAAHRPRTDEVLLDRMASSGFSGDGQLGGGKGSGSDVTGKGSGSDATGEFGSPVIKNYPPSTLAAVRENKYARKTFKCPE